jgi:hypothetical protein
MADAIHAGSRLLEIVMEPAATDSRLAPALPGLAAMYSAKRRKASVTPSGTAGAGEPPPTVAVKR